MGVCIFVSDKPVCVFFAEQLTEVISRVTLGDPMMVVLGDVNIYARHYWAGHLQDFITTTGLSQFIIDQKHVAEK